MTNLLEEVFKTPEEDVETFAEAIDSAVLLKNSEFDRIQNSDGERFEQQRLVEQISGKVKIQHGPILSDYVWHISTTSHKIDFRASDERLLFAIARVMNNYVPQTIPVNIFLPQADWDIKEYTFKAIGLVGLWSFQQKEIDKMNLELFNVLNALT